MVLSASIGANDMLADCDATTTKTVVILCLLWSWVGMWYHQGWSFLVVDLYTCRLLILYNHPGAEAYSIAVNDSNTVVISGYVV